MSYGKPMVSFDMFIRALDLGVVKMWTIGTNHGLWMGFLMIIVRVTDWQVRCQPHEWLFNSMGLVSWADKKVEARLTLYKFDGTGSFLTLIVGLFWTNMILFLCVLSEEFFVAL